MSAGLLKTPLYQTCTSEIEPEVKTGLLPELDNGFASARNSNALLSVQIAAENENQNCLTKLLSHTSHLNATTKAFNQTPLHFAANFGHEKNVEVLLSRRDVDVNALDVNNDTAAHLAAINGHLHCLFLLMNHPNYKAGVINDLGETASDCLSEDNTLRFHSCIPSLMSSQDL